MSDCVHPTPFKELLEEIDNKNIVGLWTEIHFRTITDQDKKSYAFINAKGTEGLVELIRMIRKGDKQCG